VYSEILDDKKIKRIIRETNQPKALIVGVWITLLALANDAEARGKLLISEDMPYNLEDFEDATGLPAKEIVSLLAQFASLGMIVTNDGITEIKNWERRQFISDNVTPRVRKHRENKKENETLPDNNNVTFQERYRNVIDTDTDTEQIQNRTEAEAEDLTATAAKNPPKPVKQNYGGWQERVILGVTGMVGIPGSQVSKVLPVMDALHTKIPVEEELIEYLKPYFETWISRKTKDNLAYSKSNFTWLYDWALAGHIPKNGSKQHVQSEDETRAVYEQLYGKKSK
jgi:hypothetical protein